MISNFGQMLSLTTELATMSKISMYNVGTTVAPSILIGSSSFLQLTRTAVKSRISQTSDRSDHRLRS